MVTRGCGCSTICRANNCSRNTDSNHKKIGSDTSCSRPFASIRADLLRSFRVADSCLTNHHVASDTLQKISTAENNYLRDGYLARSLEAEVPAPDLELNQLVSIDDVTEQVNSAVDSSMSAADAFRAKGDYGAD